MQQLTPPPVILQRWEDVHIEGLIKLNTDIFIIYATAQWLLVVDCWLDSLGVAASPQAKALRCVHGDVYARRMQPVDQAHILAYYWGRPHKLKLSIGIALGA